MKITIDMSKLTLGDAEDFEGISGEQITGLGKYTDDEGKTTGLPIKVLTAFIFISERKKNPKITIEEVKQIQFTNLEVDIKDSDDNPKEEKS